MRLLSTLLIGTALTTASAQCPFTPTITPDQVILCPNAVQELGTQDYDAYQWYADGTALDGETGPTLIADGEFMGQSITLEATLDGCTAQTEPVVIDGWLFLLPTIVTTGDGPYAFDGNGGAYYCEGDTVLLVMGLPYSESIQWTNSGVAVPNATNDTLVVTNTGSWSASGAPGVCPDWIQNVGVDVSTTFTEITRPEIVQVGDQLCPVPEGEAAQWYVNGAPVVTSGQCIDANVAGIYTVNVTYTTPCSVVSGPYLITGVKEVDSTVWSAFPVPANDHVQISGTGNSAGSSWILMDAAGRNVRSGSFSGKWPLRLDVSSLAPGRYWFMVPGERALAVPVMH